MRTDRTLLALLAAGFALRLVVILTGFGQPPARWEYDELAARWLSGGGYVYDHVAGVPYHAYYSGLPYVALLAACRGLTQSDLPVQLCQALFAVVSATCAAALARSLAGRTAGHVAAALTLIAPGLLYYDVAQVHPLGLDLALMLLALVACQRAQQTVHGGDKPPRYAFIVAGLLLGLAALQHNSLLLFVVLAPFVVWMRGLARGAIGLAFGIVLALGPWLARNALVVGAPVMVTTTGEHFWIGNAPGSTGGALRADGEAVIATLPDDVVTALATQDERGQQRIFWRLSADSVRHQPLAFVRGVLVKFVRFWTLAPQTGQRYARWWTWLETAWFGALLLAAAAGTPRLWRQPHTRPTLMMIVSLCLSVSAAHALFYFELRHRFVLEPLLAVVAACNGDRRARPRHYPSAAIRLPSV